MINHILTIHQMKKILTILAAVMLSGMMGVTAFAQGFAVSGVVVDEFGPVIGAALIEAGTTNGTVTDLDGNFSLRVSSPDATVEVSCIGYTTLTFKASALPKTITLHEDSEFLDEVVVIGYGTLSKKEVSSSIVQVDKKDFVQGSVNNAMEMLTGKVAGLNVSTTSAGNPNSSSSLQIRGATSLQAGNDPLVIIDGVPGGNIRNLAPQDIESMTVLKDAASAAIYGTRGANGVILVTTKKGSSEMGVAHVTYDSYFGANFVKDIPQVLTPDEFRRSLRGNDYGYSTDWYRQLLRKFSYDLNQYVSIDGGSEKGSYNASLNYKDATGLDLVDARREYGVRLAVEQKLLNNRLQINANINTRRVNETYGDDGMFDTALSMNPTMGIYNADGTYYQPTSPTGAKNPVKQMLENTSNGARLYMLASASAKLNLIQADKHLLSTTLSYSVNYNDYKTNFYTPTDSGNSYWSGYQGQASINYYKYNTQNLEWLWNYTLDLDEHTIQAVAGYSYEEFTGESFGATNQGYVFDDLLYNQLYGGTALADGEANMWSGKEGYKLIGVFARVNYNWKNMLFASASIRREGSTKFGENNKWGNFPAVSLAWEMANMDFMSGAAAVNSLKPRVSFGVTGRSGFGSYQAIQTYSAHGAYPYNGNWVTGFYPSLNANPDLGWEKLVAINLGVDFALFHNRLRGSIDLFDRQSRDLLYTYTAPQPPYIHSSILVNVGTTDNKGVELTLDYDVLTKGSLKWTTGINLSYGETVLTKLSDSMHNASWVDLYQKPGIGTSEYLFRTAEKSKVGQFYGYRYGGVNDSGEILVYNNDDELVRASTADPSFKRYIGNAAPKLFLNWNNNLSLGNWDLNLAFNGAFFYQIFNMRLYGMGLQGMNGGGNVYRTAYSEYGDIVTAGGQFSDFFLSNGDYFKLSSATLGYNFNTANWQNISSLRCYLSAKNVFTLTGYKGTDPSAVNSVGLTPSVDTNGAYPLALQLSLGIVATF